MGLKTLMGRRRKGFTLIEVVTTIFIIGLLILLVLPNINRIRDFADKKQSEAMIQTVQTQIDLYQADSGDKDVTLEELKGGKYLSDKQEKRLTDLGIKIDGNLAKKD